MKRPIAALLAALAAALWFMSGGAAAAEDQPCDIPSSLLSDTNELKHVAEAVQKEKKLTIAVIGTGSSILAGPEGPRSAYPARLEAVLKAKLPSVEVKVVRLCAGSGPLHRATFDAIRRVDPDEFKAAATGSWGCHTAGPRRQARRRS